MVRSIQAAAERLPASVESMSAEEYMAGLQRHRGRIVMAGADS